MAKGASEDRLAHLLIYWRRTPGSPQTACRQRWMTGLAEEREPWRSTEVDLGVTVVVFVGCLTSQQHASVSQGRICCHTEIEVTDQIFHLTQS